ncbi:MAG: hypothetical protein ACRCWF_18970 [Beijerinckiaceae bacterium]
MVTVSFISATILTFVVAAAHSWLGERMLIGPILAIPAQSGPLASPFKRCLLRVAWHVTSLAWIGLGLTLATLTLAPLNATIRWVAAVIGLTFLVSGLVSLVAARGRHPSWIAFLAIAFLCFWPLF